MFKVLKIELLKIIEYEIHMYEAQTLVCVLNWEFGIFCLHTFPKQEETTKKFKMKRVSKLITIPCHYVEGVFVYILKLAGMLENAVLFS